MKKTNIYTAIISLIMAVSLASCGNTASDSTASTSSVSDAANGTTEIRSVTNENGETVEVVSTTFKENSSGLLDTSEIFSDKDLEQSASKENAQKIEVSDGNTFTISTGGTYIASGTASNFTIRVEADKEDKVQIILDGVNITNDSTPAIYVVSADKCFVTTTDGSENVFKVTGSFTADGDTNTDAVVFAKDDLVFNGMGSLTIESAEGNGITGKDDIKFTGGTYSITSALDAIESKDSISICGGSYTINAGEDGMHSEDSDDDTKGSILIAGGTFNINAKSDGIRATTVAQFDGGTVEITASEGIESTYVQVNNGTITITATDDGVNVSQKSNSAGTPTFEMNDGSLTITVSGGDVDGIDANGNVTISGGTVDITYPGKAPCDAIDYDGTATMTDATLIINGEQTDSIPEGSMGGGFGGFGGKKPTDGDFPSDFEGKTPPDFDGDFPADFDGEFPDFDGDFPADFDGKTPPDGFGGGRRGTKSDTSSNSNDI